MNELAEKLNEKDVDDKIRDVNFDVACIPEPEIRNDKSNYIIVSYGRRSVFHFKFNASYA